MMTSDLWMPIYRVRCQANLCLSVFLHSSCPCRRSKAQGPAVGVVPSHDFVPNDVGSIWE